MADNYLEKKMEEHRNGGAPRKYIKSKTVTADALTPSVDIAFVFGFDTSPLAKDVVSQLIKAGIKVCFNGSDTAVGTAFAQSSGAQFYPVADNDTALGRATHLRGEIPFVVDLYNKVVKAYGIEYSAGTIDEILLLTLEAYRRRRGDGAQAPSVM